MCDMAIGICGNLSDCLKACIQMCDHIPYTDLNGIICVYSLCFLLVFPCRNHKCSSFTIYISLSEIFAQLQDTKPLLSHIIFQSLLFFPSWMICQYLITISTLMCFKLWAFFSYMQQVKTPTLYKNSVAFSYIQVIIMSSKQKLVSRTFKAESCPTEVILKLCSILYLIFLKKTITHGFTLLLSFL